MVPESNGDTTQLAAIAATLSQATASTDMPTAANPTIAPTMECVVETGHPFWLASANQVAAASKEASMP